MKTKKLASRATRLEQAEAGRNHPNGLFNSKTPKAAKPTK